MYERAAGGVTLSQLITDFGRTNNLVATAALRAKAADMNAVATADQIKLAVDEAFYNALQTFALLKVAEETVRRGNWCPIRSRRCSRTSCARSLTSALPMPTWRRPSFFCWMRKTTTRLRCRRSPRFWAIRRSKPFELVDTETELKPPPDAVSQLEDEAFSNRPEIASQNYEYQAAQHFQKAERDLLLPEIEALGVVGRTPYSSSDCGCSAVHQLVWRGGSQRQHPDLQWLSLSRPFARGRHCARRPPTSSCAI